MAPVSRAETSSPAYPTLGDASALFDILDRRQQEFSPRVADYLARLNDEIHGTLASLGVANIRELAGLAASGGLPLDAENKVQAQLFCLQKVMQTGEVPAREPVTRWDEFTELAMHVTKRTYDLAVLPEEGEVVTFHKRDVASGKTSVNPAIHISLYDEIGGKLDELAYPETEVDGRPIGVTRDGDILIAEERHGHPHAVARWDIRKDQRELITFTGDKDQYYFDETSQRLYWYTQDKDRDLSYSDLTDRNNFVQTVPVIGDFRVFFGVTPEGLAVFDRDDQVFFHVNLASGDWTTRAIQHQGNQATLLPNGTLVYNTPAAIGMWDVSESLPRSGTTRNGNNLAACSFPMNDGPGARSLALVDISQSANLRILDHRDGKDVLVWDKSVGLFQDLPTRTAVTPSGRLVVSTGITLRVFGEPNTL